MRHCPVYGTVLSRSLEIGKRGGILGLPDALNLGRARFLRKEVISIRYRIKKQKAYASNADRVVALIAKGFKLSSAAYWVGNSDTVNYILVK